MNNVQRTPAEIAKDLVATHKGSARAALNDLNSQALPQNQVVEILTEVFRLSGRDIGGVQVQPNGTQILLSRIVGTRQHIIGVNVHGQGAFGFADLKMIMNPPSIIATNVQLPAGF